MVEPLPRCPCQECRRTRRRSEEVIDVEDDRLLPEAEDLEDLPDSWGDCEELNQEPPIDD